MPIYEDENFEEYVGGLQTATSSEAVSGKFPVRTSTGMKSSNSDLTASAAKLDSSKIFSNNKSFFQLENTYIGTTSRNVGDTIYFDAVAGNGFNSVFAKLLKGDKIDVHVNGLIDFCKKILLVIPSDETEGAFSVISAENVVVGKNSIIANEDCYCIFTIRPASGDYYYYNEESSRTFDSIKRMKDGIVRSVDYYPFKLNYNQSGFYNRSGVFTSSSAWRSTEKIKVEQICSFLKIYGLEGVSIRLLNAGTASVLSNIVLWLKNGQVVTFNKTEKDFVSISNDVEYIAFSDISSGTNSFVAFKITCLKGILDGSVQNDFSLKDFYKRGYFISNFINVVVGKLWKPSFTYNAGFHIQRVLLNKGDTVRIPMAGLYDSSLYPRFVFVDACNIVRYFLDLDSTTRSNIEYTADSLGYAYYPAQSESHKICYVKKGMIKDSVSGVNESILEINEFPSGFNFVTPKFIDCPIGRNTDLFLDNAVRTPGDLSTNYPLTVVGSNKIKCVGKNHLRFNPTESSSNLDISLAFYNNINLSSNELTKTITLRPVARDVGSGQQKNICISGDSLIDGSAAPCEAFRLLNEDGDFSIKQIGTRYAGLDGVTYKHEGRGSWSWSTYTNPAYENSSYEGKKNAFMYNGVLDFQHYMSTYFPEEVAAGRGIDVFVMSLGTNDVTQGNRNISDNQAQTIIDKAKIFIDALLSSEKGYPNCKVVIGLPSIGSPIFNNIQGSENKFKLSILKLNDFYVKNFDNGAYSPNVTCVAHGMYIDSYNSYPHNDVAKNDYINANDFESILQNIDGDETVNENVKTALRYIANNFKNNNLERQWTNDVHPLPIGYKQWGFGYYAKLRAILNGLR